jgi:hypothetical protein
MGLVGVYEPMNEAITLYPNPTADYLRIGVDIQAEASLTIINTMGQVVHEQEQVSAHQSIDVKGLPKGSYTLVLSQDGVVYTARFIKQ